jgi:tripartite-type tricarboxylate transporter receptor subunit TctC
MKRLLVGLAALLLAVGPALADWKPSAPIHLWIGFGAGGETDTLGRLVAKEMSAATGWSIVVENKPGGGGIAMFTQLAVAPADGLHLGMGVTMPVLVNLTVRKKEMPFDLDSFDYLGTVALAQLALVAPKAAPFDDLKGLIAYSKKKGGALIGFDAKPQELLVKVVNAQSGAGMKLVPMESSAEGIQNLLGGHVDAAFNAGAHIPYLESGALKMIASANASRHTYAPNTATVQQQGFDIYVDPWFYIAAPKGLPPDAKAALAGALAAALKTDTVRKAITQTMHTEPADMGPAQTRAMLDAGLKNVATLFGK